MKKHIVIISEKYYCAYIPSARSQKYAFDEVEGKINLSIPEVTSAEAPVAFILSDYSHKEKGQTDIRWYEGKCWRRCTVNDSETGGEHRGMTAEELVKRLSPSMPYGHSRSRKEVVKSWRSSSSIFGSSVLFRRSMISLLVISIALNP